MHQQFWSLGGKSGTNTEVQELPALVKAKSKGSDQEGMLERKCQAESWTDITYYRHRTVLSEHRERLHNSEQEFYDAREWGKGWIEVGEKMHPAPIKTCYRKEQSP